MARYRVRGESKLLSLVVATTIILSTCGWGWLPLWCLRRWLPELESPGSDRLVLALTGFVLGSILTGSVFLLFGFLGFYHVIIAQLFTLVGLAAGVVFAGKMAGSICWRPWCVHMNVIPIVVMIIGSLALLLDTMTPHLRVDDIAYHLTVPRAWINAGGIVFYPLEPHSNFHFLSEMSYLWALLLQPESVIPAKLLEASRWIIACVGAVALARELYGSRTLALWAGATVIVLEEAFSYATSAHVDAGISVYTTVGMIWVVRWLRNPERLVAAVLAAFLLGGAIAVKQTGAIIVVPLLWVALLSFGKKTTRQWKAWLLMAIFVCLPALPWMIKNAVYTENPFFPFLAQIFPSPEPTDTGQSFFTSYHEDLETNPWVRLLPDPAKIIVFADYATTGNLNNILFLIPLTLAVMVLRRLRQKLDRESTVFAVYILLMLYAFCQTPFRRFMITLYPIVIIVLTGELFRLATTRKQEVCVYTAIAIHLFLASWQVSSYQYYRKISNPSGRNTITLTKDAEGQWYQRYSQSYQAIKKINGNQELYEGLLVSVIDPAVPLLKVDFVPNVPVVTKPLMSIRKENKHVDEYLDVQEIRWVFDEDGLRKIDE